MITSTGYGETREAMAPSKIQCDWCSDMATSKINEPCSLDGVAYACTVHGTEWYPHLFPESDVTPIETIIASIPVGVSLDKITDDGLIAARADWILAKRHAMTAVPWYPLVGHREGLRRNDLVTLASAFTVISYHGGTAH